MNKADHELSPDELRRLFSTHIPERQTIGYYFDENVAVTAKPIIEGEQIQVSTVYEMGQSGKPADTRVLAKGTSLGLVTVALDAGFVQVSERIVEMDLDHAGVILVASTTNKLNPKALANTLIRLAAKMEPWMLYNRVLTV